MVTTDRADIGYEPFDAGCRDRAYDLYARLREEAPVYRTASGYWVVSRYEDVRTTLRDFERFSSVANQTEAYGLSGDADAFDAETLQSLFAIVADMPIDVGELFAARAIVAADPPQHTRMREIANRGFTPRRIAELRGKIEAIVTECLGGADFSSEFDLVSNFTVPLPVRMISHFLSVESDHYADVKRWSAAQSTNQLGANRGSSESLANMMTMFKEVAHYFYPMIEDRKKNPRDDLITDLVRATEAETLSTVDTILFLFTVMAAGNETTTNLIGNTVVELLRNPDQLEQLQGDPELVSNALEECIRYRAPLQFVFREALQDVTLSGVTILKGDTVVVLIASANHDEDQFEDPGRFDIGRNVGHHIGFGQGVHFCLGAALGRAEARIALTSLLPHLSGLRLVEEPPLNQSMLVFGHDRILLAPRS
jgi:cytochrome P450